MKKKQHRKPARRGNDSTFSRAIYPEELIPYIRQISERYQELSDNQLRFLTSVIYTNVLKPDIFRHYSGSGFYLPKDTARKYLGRDYIKLLEPVIKRSTTYDPIMGICKESQLTANAYNAVISYLKSEHAGVLMQGSRKLKSNPKVKYYDTNGRAAIAKFRLPMAVHGRIEDVYRLGQFIGQCLDTFNQWRDTPNDFAAYKWLKRHGIDPLHQEHIDKAMRLRDEALLVVDMANKNYIPQGSFPCIPKETGTGRIIYNSPSLQNIGKAIRNAFLGGYYDTDINAAHSSFALQAGNEDGIELPALNDYISRKSAVRASIANKVGLPTDTVKAAILSVSYGARLTKAENDGKPYGAIMEMVQEDYPESYKEITEELFNNREFSAIAKDLREAQSAVIRQLLTPTQNPKWLKTPIGKTISASEPKATQSAYALQGLEAVFLHVAHNIEGNNIALMMHDGITTRKPCNIEGIQDEFYKQTGYRITLSESRLPTLTKASK